MRRWTAALAMCSVLGVVAWAGESRLTLDRIEMAGISGFRAFWDRPVVVAADGATRVVDHGRFGKGLVADWTKDAPGAAAFDAVHRSLLVRFPGAAEAIAAEMGKGRAIAKVELVLPFVDTEFYPLGYALPAGMSFLGDTWVKNKPRWHAVAWALRRPWAAAAKVGPTFNAAVNGAAYWAKYGARDERADRFPTRFGPAEVSHAAPEGRMDITALLTDAAFGASLGERLRVLADQGLLVRKWEVYDAALWWGGYEWATATGPRGIRVGAPKLVVTLAEGKTEAVTLPPPADVRKLAAGPKTGGPTAVMPTDDEIARWAATHRFAKPGWMPEWQWQRVQELKALGGGRSFPSTPEAYATWIDDTLAIAPRRWSGFDAAERTQEFMLYSEAIPEPVRDHWKLYWWAWLMPDRDIKQLVQGYIGGREAQAYYRRTRDWRGNFSVYRTYCHAMGTMNFNHWAVTGTLLGGAILGSERLLADGRHGLEHWPLRTWCWFDGTTQESIDHYYFAHSLTAQKVFADFGPTPLDRMMGQSILAKSVEELISSYHPNLRRFISSSGRTGIAYLLSIQDGLQYILHTLSPRGALTDRGVKLTKGGMPAMGHDVKPGHIAQQTLNGPWAPEWAAAMIDGKPLPYEMTVNYRQWGNYSATPLWRKTYLGRHYGLACLDVAVGNETVPVMAQWRRDERPVEHMEQLGTLILRYGINRTEMLDSILHGTKSHNPNGSVGTQGGHTVAVQHRNKMVVLTSPYPKLEYRGGRPVPERVTSLQTSVGLLNYEPRPSWQVFVDGRKVDALPFSARMSQRITIRDGVTYIALIPVPATDLGRDTEVVLAADGQPTRMQGGGTTQEALRIHAYNYRSDTPLDRGRADVDLAYGGFVIEMGDAAEYEDFAAFQRHVRDAKLDARWDAAAKTLHLAYRSGGDTIELGYRPGYKGDWNHKVPTDQVFPYRRVNGRWPYLPKGIDRDSTLTVQGNRGRLEKNGAVLTCEPGKMAYVQTEPRSGTYAGFNPFPDPTHWTFAVPGGVVVRADGKLSIARIVVRPKERRLWVDYAVRDDQQGDDMARALVVSGLNGEPTVDLNGKRLAKLPAVTIDGRKATIIPLRELSADELKAIPNRLGAD